MKKIKKEKISDLVLDDILSFAIMTEGYFSLHEAKHDSIDSVKLEVDK